MAGGEWSRNSHRGYLEIELGAELRPAARQDGGGRSHAGPYVLL